MNATIHFLYPATLRRFIAHMTEEEREIFSGMVRCYGTDYVLGWWEGGGLERGLDYFRNF